MADFANNLPPAEPIISLYYATDEERQKCMEKYETFQRRLGRGVRMNRQPHRRWEEAPIAPVAQVPMRRVDPAPLPQRPRGPEDNEIFWRIIAEMNWADGNNGNNGRNVKAALDNNVDCRDIFKAKYADNYNLLVGAMAANGMIRRNNLMQNDIITHVSNIIGMGRDTFNTLMADMEMCQYFIETAGVNLDAHLPADIRVG